MNIYALLCLLHFVSPATPPQPKAILFATSKFWFNYRQGAGILSLYQHLVRNGYSDEDVVLLIPDNLACNPRNNNGQLINSIDGDSTTNDYACSQIDYK